ncbi:phosphoinositide-interacting protein-like [Brienomyrus brachyistius]|uniref:phosphoinositide-interacting protein-like n=1 Tax=Brienomyrus brachyistius TaxID=42636 RepID=UPI0020B44D70|nr:phosphoinositide-interacting protein-like [Brienomyrus brachyistius]
MAGTETCFQKERQASRVIPLQTQGDAQQGELEMEASPVKVQSQPVCQASCNQVNPQPETTIFSLSQSESVWTEDKPHSTCAIYQHSILLMSVGGSVLLCGSVISALYFGVRTQQVASIMGPVLVSVGLMVLVVGLVLVPIIKQSQKPPPVKRKQSYPRQPIFNL